MTEGQKLELLLGKIIVIEEEMEELKLYMREIVGENLRLRKELYTFDECERLETSRKLEEEIRRIAEGRQPTTA